MGGFASRATGPQAVPFRPDFDLGATLHGAGLEPEDTIDEQIEFVFPDEQAWWRWAWSHGMRSFLELLSPPDLAELQTALFAELAQRRGANGIPMSQRATFVIARKAGT